MSRYYQTSECSRLTFLLLDGAYHRYIRRKIKEFNIGSILQFGDYNWCILNIKNNMALIITGNIIEQRAYHDAYGDITWADCELRKYLNSAFYDKFNEIDKTKII